MPGVLETSLSTADLDRSRRFFEEVLDLPPERVGDTSASYGTETCDLKLQADFPGTSSTRSTCRSRRRGAGEAGPCSSWSSTSHSTRSTSASRRATSAGR